MMNEQAMGPLDQIVGQLATSESSTVRVLGIAGCRSGDGATFVTEAFSTSLAARTEDQVLQSNISCLLDYAHASASSILAACSTSSIVNLSKLEQANVSGLLHDRTLTSLKHVATVLSSRFRFLVIDCGPVASSGTLWPLAQIVDDLFLVVAAGETRKAQIAYAQRLLARSGIRVAGCILNKRTYPVPERLYRLLA